MATLPVDRTEVRQMRFQLRNAAIYLRELLELTFEATPIVMIFSILGTAIWHATAGNSILPLPWSFVVIAIAIYVFSALIILAIMLDDWRLARKEERENL